VPPTNSSSKARVKSRDVVYDDHCINRCASF
jgi:hypothetical protein